MSGRSSVIGSSLVGAVTRDWNPTGSVTSGLGWKSTWRRTPLQADREASERVAQTRIKRLEAILFLAREPLNSRRLAQLAELRDGSEARGLIRRLNDHYQQVQRAFRIEQIAAGYRLMTRPHYAGWLRRLSDDAAPQRLSAPALETLAVIAYRQPVLRAVIEAIRGVSCGELLRQLMDRNLVRISGRSEELGRPFLYSTTRTFLSAFGLNSLDDLPPASIGLGSKGVDPQPGVSAKADDAQAVAIPSQEDADVTVTAKRQELTAEELELKKFGVAPIIVAADDDDDFGYDDEEDDDDEDEDEEELEDEEFEDEEFEDEESDDEESDDEDFDDEESDWEEVDDEDAEEDADEEDGEEFEDEEEEWDEEDGDEEEWDEEDEDEDEEEEEDEDWE